MLPTSSLYSYLEGRVPNPAYTYAKIVEIVEANETERINKEIGERRTRLGAKLGHVTLEVKREVLENSTLEHLYSCIIDWTNDDDVRRLYEEKVLQRAYDTLAVLPSQKKADKCLQVQKLAEGLVILKHPFALAWKIAIEWKDAESLEGWDGGVLREYITHFPEDGLSKVLKGYMASEISPFPSPSIPADTDEDQDDSAEPLTAEDRLLLMTEGVEESSRSSMANRLVGEYFLHLEEYSSAIEFAKRALDLLAAESQISGLKFQNNLDAVNIILATALVQYQSPRNHPEARMLFESILERKPVDTSALIGIGLILEEEEEYTGAIDFLTRALKHGPDIKVKAEAAWCKALRGDYQTGLEELESCLPDLRESDTRVKDLKSQTLYRIGVCIWNLDTTKSGRKDRSGAYARFLSSLHANLNYAPAYTSLGIYYADYAKDKKRARKCFQKAFELSASEVEAAERLAKAFADQGEWDLVEVVAQRVIESGKVRPPPGSKKKGLSWPFAALGVVQLNSQEYSKSIVSFQSALRIAPEDIHCWIGLGESYHNSGRYIAATRAFEQVQKREAASKDIDLRDTWFSRYMLANVKRELGEFEEAVKGYEDVLAIRPAEFGVSIALLQTYVESAWRNIELGFFGRAASSATQAIYVAKSITEQRTGAFNLWKGLGDACVMFSYVETYTADFPVELLQSMLEYEIDQEAYDLLANIDDVGRDAIQSMSSEETRSRSLVLCLHAAILSHKRAIYVCANDIHAQAVAWYNLGWTEYKAHMCLSGGPTSQYRSKQLRYLKTSVQCFKRAIELEASNSDFWNSLGVVTMQLNPKVSQHALVRSLYLNDKSARVWTNLGTLYLLQDDHQLANEAFTRAQSADPEYAHAWLGQGILAHLLGEVKESESLFTHAFEIADSSSIITKRQYALSAFDHLLASPASKNPITDALQPFFALHQLSSQVTNDLVFSHLSSLFAERIGNLSEAVEGLNSVCSSVEADYEITESSTSLTHFAQAKADLARTQLAARAFTSAAENAEMALDLSAEEETGSLDPRARRKYRLSAHLTAGLAYYHTGSMNPAIDMFRMALEETDGNPDTICVLTQVLWAKGGEEERNVAREQLFDCLEKHPGHIGAVTLLGVIAVLDNDQETIEAVKADLQGLTTQGGLDLQLQRKTERVLAAIASSTSIDNERDLAELAQARNAVMLAPWQPNGWSSLANLTEETYPADVALLTARGAVPPRGTLDAEDLCREYAGTSRLGDAQLAVMVAPWVSTGWEVLA